MTNTGNSEADGLDDAIICVGFWRRVVAALVDAGIGIALQPLWLFVHRYCFEKRTVLPAMALNAVVAAAFLYMVVRHGATPGKFAIRARIIDVSGRFLPWHRAVLRDAVGFLWSVAHYVHLHRVVNLAPPFSHVPGFRDLWRAEVQYGGHAYQLLSHVFIAFFVLDIFVILTNPRRRAIHDFMAGSYVVTKDSWEKAHEAGCGFELKGESILAFQSLAVVTGCTRGWRRQRIEAGRA